MPIFQNPTGALSGGDRAARRSSISARSLGLPIVEDQFDADLYYEGRRPAPLKAIDDRGQVLLLGSFSKILFPGAAPRLARGAARRCCRPLRELKQMTDFSSGLLAQCAMDLFCRRGLLEPPSRARAGDLRRAPARRCCAALERGASRRTCAGPDRGAG